jgi:RNA polymerase sigma-70 factor, ECF subfamily
MDQRGGGHTRGMRSAALVAPAAATPAAPDLTRAELRPSVGEIYRTHFDFVWRTARRLGVEPQQIDDVVQEVFITVHRRLDTFEGRSEVRTWLFGITRRVVSGHRRTRRRKPPFEATHGEVPEAEPSHGEAALAQKQGAQLLYALLDQLDEEKREAFVLSELEELSGPDIAQMLGLSLSCVYARIRSARQAFDQALRRYHAQRGQR